MGNSSEDKTGTEQRTGSMPRGREEIRTIVTQIIESNKAWLIGYFCKWFPDEDVAINLLQDTSLRLLDNIIKYGIRGMRDQDSAKRFVARCARAARVTYYRTLKARSEEKQINFPEIFVSNKPNQLDCLVVIERAENIHSALLELDEAKRYTLLSRCYENKSFKQIAAELGISISGVFNLFAQACDEMRAKLNAKGYNRWNLV